MDSSNSPRNSRAEQARLNGARSKGPTTAAGKERSRKARLVHGRYARAEEEGTSILLLNECPEQYELFRQGWLARLAPRTVSEHELVDSFVANEWRLIRAQAAEAALINNEIRATRAQVEIEAQKLSGAAKEQARLVTASLYAKSGAAEGLDRKINQLHRARLTTLQAFVLLQDRFPLPEGRTQDVAQTKPFICSEHPNPAPGATQNKAA
jgi:superfamily II DNA/RNA helicase